MHNQGIITAICFVALISLISFSQTSKHGTVGPVSFFMSLLVIPAAIAILWRLSHLFGWWTALIFIGASVLVAVINYRIRLKHGTAALFSLQPILGAVFIAGAIGSWLI